MNGFGNPKGQSTPLSVTVVTVSAFWYMAILAGLTILTQLAQIFSIAFKIYAYACIPIAIIISGCVFVAGKNLIRESFPKDTKNLIFILLLGLIGVFLSVSMHRLGRIGPDEYYYSPNAVYSIQYPDAAMGFVSRLFFSRTPMFSVSFFTAGPYEYIQAAAAFLSHASFVTVYYRFAAGAAGFLIPLSIFLVIFYFCGEVESAILGALVTVCAITVTAETAWTPGVYSFIRAFEGKSFLLSAGMPLFAAFSFRYFVKQDLVHWLQLTALVVGLGGMSTTSFMILPMLGVILFLSHWVSFRNTMASIKSFLLHCISYFSIFLYLGVYALAAAHFDGLNNAIVLNKGFPTDFMGYLSGFVNPSFPITAVMAVVFSVSALIILKGTSRLVLSLWMAFTVLFVLNPIVSQILLNYFKGIYFRAFYIFPFPAVVGITTAAIYMLLKRRRVLYGYFWGLVICGISLASVFLLPSSILHGNAYDFGNWINDPTLVTAREIAGVAPKGIMLAPYPISGAISMSSGNYPQMLARPDLILFYLNLQNKEEDASLRLEAQKFLVGQTNDIQPIEKLLTLYPEIRSLVFYNGAYLANEKIIKQLLDKNGFVKVKDFVSGIVIFEK
jgi:hypothetical protein